MVEIRGLFFGHAPQGNECAVKTYRRRDRSRVRIATVSGSRSVGGTRAESDERTAGRHRNGLNRTLPREHAVDGVAAYIQCAVRLRTGIREGYRRHRQRDPHARAFGERAVRVRGSPLGWHRIANTAVRATGSLVRGASVRAGQLLRGRMGSSRASRPHTDSVSADRRRRSARLPPMATPSRRRTQRGIRS